MLSKVWVKDLEIFLIKYWHLNRLNICIYTEIIIRVKQILESLYFIGNGKTPDKNSIETLLHFNSDSAYLGSDVIKDNEMTDLHEAKPRRWTVYEFE